MKETTTFLKRVPNHLLESCRSR